MKVSNVVCIALFLNLLLPTVSAWSQTGKTYKGRVMDKLLQESIPYATIAFYNEQGLIGGTSTDQTGRFTIEVKEAFTYMEVSFLGYEKFTYTAAELQKTKDLIIYLETSSSALDEIVVEGERTHTQLKIDRKIINLGADLQQSGSTALEAFDQLTEIQTDHGTGNITLRGSGNVRLLINGKPSALRPSELLAQIPAAAIESVEIITSPSAKNQADGLSGIINIKLKKSLDPGLNLSLNAAAGTKRHGYGMSGNYHLKRMNIRWSASEAIRRMDSHQTISQRYNDGSTRDFFAPHDFAGIVRKVATGIDFFINPQNEISFELDYTYDHHDFFNDTFYTNVTGRDDYLYRRISAHTHKTLNTNINYRKGLSADNHFIEFDYNFTRNNNFLPAEDFEDGNFLFEEEKKNRNTLQALAVDYSHPLNNQTKIEAGFSWNGRAITSQDFFGFEQQADRTGLFTYQEDILGAYSLIRATLGKFNWQAGLRYEHFESSSNNSTENQYIDLQFSNLFPSFHASLQINEASLVNLGYSKRASRPNFNHVNPFRLGNQYFRWNGNAGLLPEFSHNLETNYQNNGKVASWSASAFYHFRTDVIEQLQSIDEAGVLSIGFDNIGQKHAFGLESDISVALTSFWDTQLSANYYRTNLDQRLTVTWDQLYSSGFIFKNTFKIGDHLSADLTFRHTGNNRNIFDERRARNRLDVAVRARLFKNKLTANFRIIDVLDDNLMYRKTVTPEVIQNEVWRFQSQTFGVLLSIDYKLFQNTGKLRNRKTRDYRHGGSID